MTAFENDFSGSIGGIGGFVTNEWCKNSRISIVEKIMKYLVTGGAGFIGSYITKRLVEEEEQESKKCPFCKDRLQELEFNPNCELKPDPLIMTLEYMQDYYQWFLKTPYQKI